MPDTAGPTHWDARTAIASLPLQPWVGDVWRAHAAEYAATDVTGARRKSGRFHRAPDLFPRGPTWPVLYLALGRDVCLAEIIRNATSVPLRRYRITRLHLRLQAVLDCRDLDALGVSADELLSDVNLEVPQRLAMAALNRGAEGLLVPSATFLGDNLVLFADQVKADSVVQEIDHIEPRLSKLGPIPVQPGGPIGPPG